MTTSSGASSLTPNGLSALPVFAGPWLELLSLPPLVAQADSTPAPGTARKAVRPIPRSIFRRERSVVSALSPMVSDISYLFSFVGTRGNAQRQGLVGVGPRPGAGGDAVEVNNSSCAWRS